MPGPSPSQLAKLAERVRDPGFTPSVRDLDALVDLLLDDDLAKPVERAIGRIGAPALAKLRTRLEAAKPPLRGRIVKAIGRLASEPAAVGLLVEVLERRRSEEPPQRRHRAGEVQGRRSRTGPHGGVDARSAPGDAPLDRRVARQDGGRGRARLAAGCVASRRPGARPDRGARVRDGRADGVAPLARAASTRAARPRGRSMSSSWRGAGSSRCSPRSSWPSRAPATCSASRWRAPAGCGRCWSAR